MLQRHVVLAQARREQLVEHPPQDLEIDRLGRRDQDAVDHRRQASLVAIEQLLVELLAGAQAGERDLDVLVRAQAGEPDHLARDIDDPDRLTHVENEDLTPLIRML